MTWLLMEIPAFLVLGVARRHLLKSRKVKSFASIFEKVKSKSSSKSEKQQMPAQDRAERLAEDGIVSDIGEAFVASGEEGAAGVITGPDGVAAGPLDPGESGSIVLAVDPNQSQFLSFASMVIPSNDAFISSPDDPMGLRIFDEKGNFTGGKFEVTGADVLDAGTEVNTEQDAAFLNQTGPDTGVDEGGVVTAHPGFIGSVGLPATDAPAQFPESMISAKY